MNWTSVSATATPNVRFILVQLAELWKCLFFLRSASSGGSLELNLLQKLISCVKTFSDYLSVQWFMRYCIFDSEQTRAKTLSSAFIFRKPWWKQFFPLIDSFCFIPPLPSSPSEPHAKLKVFYWLLQQWSCWFQDLWPTSAFSASPLGTRHRRSAGESYAAVLW